MKTVWSAIIIALTFSPGAYAEEPIVPENIRFADVCSYHTFSSKLNCRDAGGNVLIKDHRVFKKFRWTAYPALPVVSTMKRLGFEPAKHKQVSDDVEILFWRPVTCQ